MSYQDAVVNALYREVEMLEAEEELYLWEQDLADELAGDGDIGRIRALARAYQREVNEGVSPDGWLATLILS